MRNGLTDLVGFPASKARPPELCGYGSVSLIHEAAAKGHWQLSGHALR